MNNKKVGLISLTLVLILCVGATLVNFNMAQADGKTQISISRMDNLPSVATDYDYKDWKQTTKDYVDYVLSESSVYDGQDPWGNSLAENPSKVVSYEDASNIDAFFEETGNKYWSIRTYLGLTGGSVEAINSIAAVLSGAQIGLDMTNYSVNGQTPRNYVRDMVAFYQAESGFNVVLNNATGSGGSFWYALLPGCLFINLYQYYPQETYLKEIIVEMSKVWLQCVENMGGANCDFSNCQGYDIGTSKPTYSAWKEPDAAAGLAYILYGGYSVAKDDPAYASLASGFLTGSIWCMDFLEGLDYSPFYEVLTFLAPPVASKLNALHGKNYDLTKYINWTLDGSSRVRGGWGMINESWGGKHTYGLMGSLTDGGGYAFAMNTFDAAWGFVPMVKYDTRYADSIGKWMLNASNSARYFYGDSLPLDGETITDTVNGKTYSHWSGYYQANNYFSHEDKESSFIAYEGLRKYRKGFHRTGESSKSFFSDEHSPYASGDAFTLWVKNESATDLGLYGSSHVGFFGSIISATDVPQILRLDLNAADYFGQNGYPQYLYYNPYNQVKTVSYKKSDINARLYDAINKKFIDTQGSGETVTFNAAANSATVVVELPAEGEVTSQNGIYYLNGVYVTSSRSTLSATVDKYEDGAWASISNGDNVNGKIRVSVSADIDPTTSVTHFALSVAGKEICSQNDIPQDYVEVDLSSDDFRSGNGKIEVTLELANGSLLKKSISIIVAKSKLEAVMSFDTVNEQTEAFAANKEAWNNGKYNDLPFDCDVTSTQDATKITNLGDKGFGSAFTRFYGVDLSRTPKLEFDINQVSSLWALKVFVEGGSDTGYYIVIDTDETGHYNFDLLEAIKSADRTFDLEGVQSVSVWILPTGGTNCYVTISNLKIYYLFDFPVVEEPSVYEWGFTFTTGHINLWQSQDDNATVRYNNGFTELCFSSNGKVASPYVYTDLSRNPVFNVVIGNAEGEYSLGVAFEGDDTVYLLATNLSGASKQTVAIADRLKKLYPQSGKSGICNLKIIVVGVASAQISLQKVQTYYQLTQWGVTVSGSGFDEWSPNAMQVSKGLIAPNENGKDYRIQNGDASSNLTSIKGASGKYDVNFDRNPVVSFSIADVKGKWEVSVAFFDDPSTNYTLIELNSQKYTKTTINLRDALTKSGAGAMLNGVKSIYLQINVQGGKNYVDVRKVATDYDVAMPSFEEGTIISGSEIATWDLDSEYDSLLKVDGNATVLQENLRGIAAITSPLVAVSRNVSSALILDVEKIVGALKVYAVVGNQKYLISPKNGYVSAGTITIDVWESLASAGYDGVSEQPFMAFRFEVAGAGASATFNEVRFAYRLGAIEKITVSGNVLSWEEVPGAEWYKVSIYNAEGKVIRTERFYQSCSYDVTKLNLGDGVYRIEVTPGSATTISGKATAQGFKQGDIESVRLSKVSDFDFDGLKLTFSKSDNAQGYSYVLYDVDENEIITQGVVGENMIDFGSVGLSAYNYKLTVTALGDGVAYLDSDETVYEFATPTVGRFVPKVLATYSSVNNNAFATVTESGSALLQLPKGGNWGEIGSVAFNLNMDENPVWYIRFGKITHGYYLRVYVDNNLLYIDDKVRDNSARYVNVVSELRQQNSVDESLLTGTHTVRFCFGVTGITADVSDPTVEIITSRLFTTVPGYVAPVVGELATPSVRVEKDRVVWDKVDNAQNYYVTVSNEFGTLYSQSVTDCFVDLSFLSQEGEYYVTVTARGDKYFDSEQGLVTYNLQDSKQGCNSVLSANAFAAGGLFVALVATVLIRKKRRKERDV